MHPNSYTTPQANEAGTYTEAPGFVEDINTRKDVRWDLLWRVADVSSLDAISLRRRQNVLYFCHGPVHATVWLLIS